MKRRSPLAVFFLGLITFGIYDLYWLVKTKAVLNKKTRFHTPTIWLLILPSIILMAGYITLFASSLFSGQNNTSSGSPGPTLYSSASSTSPTASGEQLSSRGQTRPAQYKHICITSGNKQYVSQGSPNCLPGDSYSGDYGSGVPGTLYSSPCKTTSGDVRYVYVAQNESCPANTELVFYNDLCDAGAISSAQCSTSGKSTVPDGSSTSSNVNPALLLISIGLIAIGFPATIAISIFWFFRFSKAIDEYTRGKMSTAVTFLILWLVHLIGVALIQDAFNEMEDEGAAAPTISAAAPTASRETAPPPIYPPAPTDRPQPSISEEPHDDHQTGHHPDIS